MADTQQDSPRKLIRKDSEKDDASVHSTSSWSERFQASTSIDGIDTDGSFHSESGRDSHKNSFGGAARWLAALDKATHTEDPFAKTGILDLPEERAIRYQYDARTGSWKKDEGRIKMEPTAFAKGSLRSCFRMKKLSNWIQGQTWDHAANYVAKTYTKTLDAGVNRELVFTDVKVQMIAKQYAEYFNQTGPPKSVDMMRTFALELPDRPGAPCFCVERYLEGEYVKYNSNVGYIDESRLTPQAFSHFTFERSAGSLLIVDIQGVGDLYTDPQIHTLGDADAYGEGNLGIRGYALFFHTHRCNAVCAQLQLLPFEHFRPVPSPLSEITSTRTVRQRPAATGRPSAVMGVASLAVVGRTPSNPKAVEQAGISWKAIVGLAALYEVLQTIPPTDPLYQRLFKAIDEVKEVLKELKRTEQQASRHLQSLKLPSVAPVTAEPEAPGEESDASAHGSGTIPARQRMSSDDVSSAAATTRRHDDAGLRAVLGLVHRQLGMYHESETLIFSKPSAEDAPQAALFHYRLAAQYGSLLAQIALANVLSDMPGAELTAIHVEPTPTEAFQYALVAAEQGSRVGALKVAKAYETGAGVDASYRLAITWYERVAETMCGGLPEDDASGSFECGIEDHEVWACIASLYVKGGHGRDDSPDLAKARDAYYAAAEAAENVMKAKKAAMYYNLAEKMENSM